MKKFFYFVASLAIIAGLSSCGSELIPIKDSEMYLIPSDQPEYGKYNLYNPYTEERIYPALDTAYVIWDKILGYSNYDKEYFIYSNQDGRSQQSAIQIYFISFERNEKEHRFLVYQFRENGKNVYEISTVRFGWPWRITKKRFDDVESLPKVGNDEPDRHRIRLDKAGERKIGILYENLYNAGKI